MIWRIRERSAFTRVAREGKRARAGVLWCTHLLDSSAVPPRVGFAIGRAVGSATVRNRIRRQLRSLLRDTDVAPGWYVIGVRPDAAGRSFAELQFDLQRLLRSVHPS